MPKLKIQTISESSINSTTSVTEEGVLTLSEKNIYLGLGNSKKIKYDGTSGTSLDPATTDKLGGIKVGKNLEITNDGTLSVSDSLTFDTTDLETKITNLNTNLTTLETQVGDLSTLETINKSSIVESINELDTTIETIKASGYDDTKLKELIATKVSQSDYDAKVTELETSLSKKLEQSDIADFATISQVGTLTNLTTTNKNSIVEALNEINAKDVDLSAYYTKTETDTKLADYTNTTDLQANYVSYTEGSKIYATQNDLDLKADKTEISNFATDDELQEVSNKIGDLAYLDTTEKSNVVASLNEIEAKVEKLQTSGYDDTELRTLISTKANQSDVNDINTALGDTSTLGAENIISTIETIQSNISNLSTQAMTEIANSKTAIATLQNNQGEIANLTTSSTNLVDAINEVSASVKNVDHSAFATKTELTDGLNLKLDKTEITQYLTKTENETSENEIKSQIGTLSNLNTTAKTSIVEALNEISSSTDTEFASLKLKDTELQNNIDLKVSQSDYDTKIAELEKQDTTLQNNIDLKVSQSDYNTKITELETKDTDLETLITQETTRATNEETRLQNEIDGKTKAAVYAKNTEFKVYDFVIHANKIYLVAKAFTASGNFSSDEGNLVALQDDSGTGVVTYAANISIKNGQTVLHNTDDGKQELYICTQDIENTTTWDVDSTKMVSYGASVSLDNYYDKTQVDALLANKMDLLTQGDGVKVTRTDNVIEVSADMSVEATPDKISQRGNEGELNASTPSTLTNTSVVNNKQLTDTLTQKLADYATLTQLNTKANSSDLDNYATLTDLNTKANSSDLDNYATLTQLNAKVDTSTYTAKVQDLETQISNKQDTLTAGTNITIQNGVISGTAEYDDTEIRAEIAKKQNALVAGDGITIDANTNTISSTMTGIEIVDTMPTNPSSGVIYFVRAYS